MSTKGCPEFLLYLDLWAIDKSGFCACVETRPFFVLPNNSRSKQNTENIEHVFVNIGK